MACEIIIDSVRGEGSSGSPPSFTRILGRARECPGGIIEILLTRLPRGPSSTGIARVTPDSPILEPWSAELTNIPFNCGDFVSVEARCRDNPDCIADPLFEGELFCEQCHDTVALGVHNDAHEVVDADDCLPAGSYAIRVIDPVGPGLSYSWSVDGTVISGATISEYTLVLSAGETKNITVIVIKDGCPPISGGVILHGCPADCPDTVALEVRNNAHDVVDVDDCLPAGSYSIRVINPTSPGLSFSWSVNGTVASGAMASEYTHTLSAEETDIIAVAVIIEDCPPIPSSVELNGCPTDCPGAITLEVRNDAHEAVDVHDCLPTGGYTIRVIDPMGPGLSFSWSVDGTVVSGATRNEYAHVLSVGETDLITVVVTSEGCPPISDGIELNGCPADGPSTGACCLPDGGCEQLTKEECRERDGEYKGDRTSCDQCDGDGTSSSCGSMVWIVGALFAVAMALTILTTAWTVCIPPPAGPAPWWVWIVVGVAWGIAAIAVGVWYLLCALIPDCQCPTECNWLQIGTIAALSGAVIASYLITCCSGLWWLLAAGLGSAFIAALIAWIVSCQPSLCQILAALLVAIVSVAAPAIAYIALTPLSACGSSLVDGLSATAGGILALATAIACATD